MRPVKRVAASATAAAALMVLLAAKSAADPTTHLRSEIDAARSAAGCPPFELDPTLNDVSQLITRQVVDWVKHSARFFPTTGDAALMRVLRESGYPTIKARLLEGYGDYRTGGTGDNEDKAIKGAVLQGIGFEVLSDCAFTKYGLSAINEDSGEGWPSTPPRAYAVTTVVVAGD